MSAGQTSRRLVVELLFDALVVELVVRQKLVCCCRFVQAPKGMEDEALPATFPPVACRCRHRDWKWPVRPQKLQGRLQSVTKCPCNPHRKQETR